MKTVTLSEFPNTSRPMLSLGGILHWASIKRVIDFRWEWNLPILSVTLNIALNKIRKTARRPSMNLIAENFPILCDEKHKIRFKRYIHNG